MLKIKERVIPYTKFHKINIISSIISAVLWIGWSVIFSFVMNDNKKLLPNIILVILFFISLSFISQIELLTAGMRDKEDELYRENIAKTNSLFLWIMFFMGCAIFLTFMIVPYFKDNITLSLDGKFIAGFVAGFMYLMNAVYHYIALRYERSSDTETENE